MFSVAVLHFGSCREYFVSFYISVLFNLNYYWSLLIFTSSHLFCWIFYWFVSFSLIFGLYSSSIISSFPVSFDYLKLYTRFGVFVNFFFIFILSVTFISIIKVSLNVYYHMFISFQLMKSFNFNFHFHQFFPPFLNFKYIYHFSIFLHNLPLRKGGIIFISFCLYYRTFLSL